MRAALTGASAALNVTLVCLPVFTKRGPNGRTQTRREEEQNPPHPPMSSQKHNPGDGDAGRGVVFLSLHGSRLRD